MILLSKYRSIIAVILFHYLLPFTAISQSGRVYEFLNLPTSARMTAVGGYGIPDAESDIDMALFYPSLINSEMHQKLSLNFVDYFDDINYGTAAYSHTFERYGSFTGRIQYISYGKFEEADETGERRGAFSAGEYAAVIGWGRQLGDEFYIGSNLKIIASDFYEASSLGLAVDVSGSYINQEHLFAAGLLFRNIGRQVTYYHGGNNEPLPFEIVVGASKKLLNAPIRLYGVAHNIQKYDITIQRQKERRYFYSDYQNEKDNSLEEVANIIMHHLILGMELLPTKNLSLRMGYKYRRRQELKVESRLSTVGFSWGFGLQISKFNISYGRSDYHLAASPNHFSIAFNIDDVFRGGVKELPNFD